MVKKQAKMEVGGVKEEVWAWSAFGWGMHRTVVEVRCTYTHWKVEWHRTGKMESEGKKGGNQTKHQLLEGKGLRGVDG